MEGGPDHVGSPMLGPDVFGDDYFRLGFWQAPCRRYQKEGHSRGSAGRGRIGCECSDPPLNDFLQ